MLDLINSRMFWPVFLGVLSSSTLQVIGDYHDPRRGIALISVILEGGAEARTIQRDTWHIRAIQPCCLDGCTDFSGGTCVSKSGIALPSPSTM